MCVYASSRHFWRLLLKKGSNLDLCYIYCSFEYGSQNCIWESYRSEQIYGECALLQRISKIADLWALHWWPFQKYGRAISVTGSSNTAQRCSVEKMFLEISQNSQENTCQSLFFNKVGGLRPMACNFIKKETLVQVFSCEFCEISKSTFFIEHFWWLLLSRKES